jgi:hypothetical protein
VTDLEPEPPLPRLGSPILCFGWCNCDTILDGGGGGGGGGGPVFRGCADEVGVLETGTSCAVANDAVELAVPVRLGSGGGFSSKAVSSSSPRETLANRVGGAGRTGPGSGLSCGTATWLDDVVRVDGLTGLGGGCFLAAADTSAVFGVGDDDDLAGISTNSRRGVAARTTGDDVVLMLRL